MPMDNSPTPERNGECRVGSRYTKPQIGNRWPGVEEQLGTFAGGAMVDADGISQFDLGEFLKSKAEVPTLTCRLSVSSKSYRV